MKYLSLLLVLSASILFSSCGSSDEHRYALIETDFGSMKVMLYNTTPIHRDNFVKLVDEGFYDGLLFHRVMQGFMIQGGDPDSRGAAPGIKLGQGGPGYTLEAEIGAPHFKGALAAARLGGPQNPEKRSSGSQFYVVQGKQVPAQQLSNYEVKKGITYSPEQKELYSTIGGTPMLDMDYTVFGEVVKGFEVIDAIAAQPVSAERPNKDVTMTIKMLN